MAVTPRASPVRRVAPGCAALRRVAGAAAIAVLLLGCGRVEKDRPLDEVIAAARGGDPAAVRDLINRVPHPDQAVSLQAWEALIALGPAAEEELVGALSARDPDVAEAAAGALGNVGTKQAVGALTGALESWKSRRYVAAWALGEIQDPAAIPALASAMGDEDPEVRKYATRSLIKFGAEATPTLLKSLEDPSEEVRHYALRALGEIRDERSIDALLGLAGKADRKVFVWALGRLGDRRGYPLVAAAVEDADRDVRLAAIQALNDLGDERAVVPLTRGLDDPEWMIREWSARGLESITGSRQTYRNQRGEEVYPYSLYR